MCVHVRIIGKCFLCVSACNKDVTGCFWMITHFFFFLKKEKLFSDYFNYTCSRFSFESEKKKQF